jgi:hypothetical protein
VPEARGFLGDRVLQILRLPGVKQRVSAHQEFFRRQRQLRCPGWSLVQLDAHRVVLAATSIA